MSDPFLGEIKMFAGNFAPRNYATADGQLLPISQSTALFALFGTTYGGDGRSTFALPDLRGRAPMQSGQGPGLTQRSLGESAGSPTVTLQSTQIPSHTHGMIGEDEQGATASPAGAALGYDPTVNLYTSPNAPGIQFQNMAPTSLGNGGGGLPHNNMQPYLVLTFIVALSGIFPQRP